MEIGSFATITFQVSQQKVLTFDEFSRSGGARWSVHDVNQNKPMPEYIGPGQEGLSLKIRLKTAFGVNPESAAERLRGFRNRGELSPLIIGNKPVTNGYWYIEDVSEAHKFYDQNGMVHSIELTINLKEYPKPTVIRTKPKTVPADGSASGGTTAKKTETIGEIKIRVDNLNCRTSPSLTGKVKTQLQKNKSYKVYGKVKTDIEWYILGGGLYCSADEKYVDYQEGVEYVRVQGILRRKVAKTT